MTTAALPTSDSDPIAIDRAAAARAIAKAIERFVRRMPRVSSLGYDARELERVLAGRDASERFAPYTPRRPSLQKSRAFWQSADASVATSLFTLLDDIATVLDDVALLTKVATKKTAGVLGDDLALNAEQVAGVAADRELPVVWAVAKGSAKNKLVIVPAALAISAIAPWAIVPLLMVGGTFLCFEGFEKVVHKLLHGREEHDAQHRAELQALADPQVDIVAFEKEKIRGAIRTDIILSAEIIVITLGTVAGESFGKQVAVLCAIAVLMTIGVYGFVAGIVKLDDAGVALSRRESSGLRTVGRGILRAAPLLMKGLSIAGTAAMFLVGGGILTHGIAPIHHLSESIAARGGAMSWLGPTLVDAGTGIVAGGLAVAVVTAVQRLRNKRATQD